MRESYREDVPSHPDPRPCEGGCEAAREVRERGIRRQDIQLRGEKEHGKAHGHGQCRSDRSSWNAARKHDWKKCSQQMSGLQWAVEKPTVRTALTVATS
jgi:hypothetical protein